MENMESIPTLNFQLSLVGKSIFLNLKNSVSITTINDSTIVKLIQVKDFPDNGHVKWNKEILFK
jgi:hypothetical protein